MGKEEHIAAACANAADDTVRTRAHGVERLTAGAAVAEKTPAGALLFDIDGASTLVGAVIPFHQIVVRLHPRARQRNLGSAAGALQRTREDAIEAQCGEARPDIACLVFAPLAKRNVRAAGVLSAYRPCGLAVPD